MTRVFFEPRVLGGTMPLFSDAKAQHESATHNCKRTNQLANRPSFSSPICHRTNKAQTEQTPHAKDMVGSAGHAFAGPKAIEEVKMSAMLAKHFIMRHANESLIAQARLLDNESLRLLG